MRKAAVMIGFGAFFLTMALLMRFYALPKLAVIPSDLNTQQVVADDHARYFDANTLKAAQGPIVTRTTVTVDKDASKQVSKDLKKDVLVLNEWQSTNSPKDEAAKKPPIDAFTERVAVDKSSGAAVRWSGNEMNGKSVDISGQTIKLPFGVSKSTTYEYWDTTLERSFPLTYDGAEKVKGMTTYRFTQSVPLTKFRTQDVPGEVFGLAKGGKVADRMYGNDRTMWVDPETGVIMKLEEKQHETLNVSGAAPVNAMTTTSTFTDETIAKNVKDYQSKSNQLKVLRLWAPLFLGLLGLAAIVLGLLVSLAAGRNRRVAHEEETVGGATLLMDHDDHHDVGDHHDEALVHEDEAPHRARGAHLPEHDDRA